MNEKLVIFDFADTIAKLSPSKEELLQKFIFDKCGEKVLIKDIEEVYHYSTNLLFYSSVKIQDIGSKKDFYIDFNKSLLSLLGLSHKISAIELFEYFNKHGQHWTLKSGVVEMLKTLKEKNCLISLVSNFDSRLYDILNDMNVYNYFDSVFISQEVGLEKPDIEFFKLPLKEHNIKNSSDTCFVGDSYILDFIPSNHLGIKPILLDEKKRYSYIPEGNKIYNIVDILDKVK